MANDCSRLLSSLEHNFGPLVMGALLDPEVVEIMLNPDGNLWIEKLGRDMELSGRLEVAQARLIINLVASGLNTTVTARNPIVEGELPLDGSRFEGVIPPIVSAPSFTIRKKASKVFQLEDYAKAGIMPGHLIAIFKGAIKARRNILVVGGTGSGKTTLVNGFIHELAQACPGDRLVIIEDTQELQSQSPNTVFLKTADFKDADDEDEGITMRRLLRVTMRYRPDRILIGEVRDGAALDLLKAWNTGHPGGVATVHANSAEEGLDRLEELVAEATTADKRKLIGRAVNLVVFIERAPGGRRISQVIKVSGYDAGHHQYLTEVIYHADPINQQPGNGQAETTLTPMASFIDGHPGPLA